MTFGEHLGELRTRVLKALIASLVGLIAVFIYHEEVFAFVTEPYRDVMEELGEDTPLIAGSPTEAFFAHLKVSFVVGLILTAPFWIYQLWAFIVAGLYGRERRVVYKFAPLCLVLFFTGVFFGYLILIPIGLEYLLDFAARSVVRTMITIREYLRFFTILTLLLGVAFELPVVMLGMVKAGIVTPDDLRQKRKWALILIFVMAAFFTPPDPVTQILLAVPLIGLYQLGIFLGWLSLGRDRPPPDWKARWKLARTILIVAGLLFVVRNYLSDMWVREQLDKRLFRVEDREQASLFDVGKKVFGLNFAGAYLVQDESGGASKQALQVWVMRAASRCYVVNLHMRRVDFQVMDRPPDQPGRWVEFAYYPQRKVIHRMELPEEVPFSEFLPALLEAYDRGSDELRQEVGAMLRLLCGHAPDGDEEKALDAFRKWYEENRLERFFQ